MSLSILALFKRDGNIEEVTLELLGKAKRFYNNEINIILISGNEDNSNAISLLEQSGANKIFIIKNEKLNTYSTINYKNAVLKALEIIA